MEKLIKESDVAEYLNVSSRSVSRLRAKRGLPYFKIGGHVRFKLSQVEKWLKDQKRCKRW